jgi:hypothetical protein
MKIKTSELEGAALDYAVALAEGNAPEPWLSKYSSEWAWGGPIIEWELIEIVRGNDVYFPKGNEDGDLYEQLWLASINGMDGKMHGRTPLQAAMRCYVASKLGDEVEIPEEARAMLSEYRMSDPSAQYYLSGRACKDWRESK